MNNYPNVIYFCNKQITEKDIIASNRWKILNPEYEIKLYDDEMIKIFLVEEFGELHKKVFEFLKAGPIKADFWRACILYKNGGVYSDIDNVPLVKLSDFIEKDVDFVTCSSYAGYKFNPNFIIANKGNIFLEKCIDWYIDKFTKNESYKYWGWSIMTALSQILQLDNFTKNCRVYHQHGMKIQIIKECRGTDHYDAHNIYNGIRVFNNRSDDWDSKTHKFK